MFNIKLVFVKVLPLSDDRPVKPTHPNPMFQQHTQHHGTHTRERRPLDSITCYKCGEKGHFANRCPKGHLAFLSAAKYSQSHPPASTT
ncbi:cleavage and polyadenylation specificity factor subunit 4 [Plakobranchus ocellatus]|uniref:Cleavage and polyadenylation specificity factor subunit 4 n=1 Tax=Plakobranchus ocellatus TaxID=259542 RepID=A0AAV4A5A5_9GAST|nr:cleavage and polyadenylation specificity factor subunit 4 [Plakobranchus ocellatus]